MTSSDGNSDLSVSWRDASYAFVDVEELNSGREEPTVRLEVAVVRRGAEPRFYTVIDRAGARGRPGQPASEACSELVRVTSGRLVVAHGTGAGWRRLAAICPELRPLTVLDTMRLSRTLLPGGRHGLYALMARLDMQLPELQDSGTGQSPALRNAVLLADIFERLVDRLAPAASLATLLHMGEPGAGDPLPELGLENGQ